MDNGTRIEDFSKFVDHFISHFQSFMGMDSQALWCIDPQIIDCGNVLTIDQQLALIKPFSIKEIKEALFSISVNKSPGFNGFGSGFFKES